jgi:hypothetical protein
MSIKKVLWLVLGHWLGFFIFGYSILHPEYRPSYLIADKFNQELRPLGQTCVVVFYLA